jgi:hypothetical protein
MAAVFQEAAGDQRSGGRLSYARFVSAEFAGVLAAAGREWFRHLSREGRLRAAASAVSGAAAAWFLNVLLYTVLLPPFHAHAQARPDVPPLEIVTTLYRNTFAALHNAKTKEDIAKMVDAMEAPDWVSIDPNGYTVLTRDQEVRQLEDFLNVPPEKRPSNPLEILWLHEESWKITVVDLVHSGVQGSAALPEFRSKEMFGPNAEARFVLAGSLVRDTFARTPQGWRRIRHEKLLPDQFQRIQGDSVLNPTVAPELKPLP